MNLTTQLFFVYAIYLKGNWEDHFYKKQSQGWSFKISKNRVKRLPENDLYENNPPKILVLAYFSKAQNTDSIHPTEYVDIENPFQKFIEYT